MAFATLAAATTAFAASVLAAVALSGWAGAAFVPLVGGVLGVFVLLDGAGVTAAFAPVVASRIEFDLVLAIAAALLLPLAPMGGLVAFAAPELGVEVVVSVALASAGGLAPLVASGIRLPTGFTTGVALVLIVGGLFAADAAAEPLAVFAAVLPVVSAPLVADAGVLAPFKALEVAVASLLEPLALPAFAADPSAGAEVCWAVG